VNTYRRTIQHGQGTPGIFIKFDVDPMEMNVWQRTTSFPQFFIRLCGVIGGVWVCAGWAVKIFARAATAAGVVGKDEDSIVNEVENARLRKKASARWGGSDIRARSGGSSWTIDGGSPVTPMSPYTPGTTASTNGYLNTPTSSHSLSYVNGLAPANVPLPVTPLPGTPASASFTPNGHTPSYPYANGRLQPVRGPSFTSSGPSTPIRMDSPQTPPMLSPSAYAAAANGSSGSLRPKSNLNPAASDKRID